MNISLIYLHIENRRIYGSLKLIVLDNIWDLGKRTNDYLKQINKNDNDYIIPITRSRFSNGEGKIKIMILLEIRIFIF